MQLNLSFKRKKAQIRSKLLIGVSCGLKMTNLPRGLNTKASNLFGACYTGDHADKKKPFRANNLGVIYFHFFFK